MNIHFATPWVLAMLPVVLAIALLPRLARNRSKPAGLRFSDNSLTRVAPPTLRLVLRPLFPALRWLAVALVIVAAARPQSGDAHETIKGEGVDIALALRHVWKHVRRWISPPTTGSLQPKALSPTS